MPLTSVVKDPEALTITVVADFPVPVERLWNAYADPRQLEKFWGPYEYPARFTRHDMVAGGRSQYVMVGPEGDRSPGYWEFLSVDPGRGFEVRDGFADADGNANTEMPALLMTIVFEGTENGSRLISTTTFASLEAMEMLSEMGMEQGTRESMEQIDGMLADLASFAAGRATEADILSDTEVRVARVIRGTVDQVWRAHHDPDLMKKWLLGPDGWTMPVCDVATEVGQSYRYEWEETGTGQRFGFVGELLESYAPHRAVNTEHMTGTDYPSTTNELTLTPVPGGTLLSLLITYPSAEVRDAVLATGMTDGMETSYARLEEELASA